MIINPLSKKVNFRKLASDWGKKPPFDHIVIDNFLDEKWARSLEAEYPSWEEKMWYQYDNPIEQKKALNHWDRFPAATYYVMTFFNSPEFVKSLEILTGIWGLQIDPGLHGGGWHGHTAGGKLNVHLDYSMHPKLKLERRPAPWREQGQLRKPEREQASPVLPVPSRERDGAELQAPLRRSWAPLAPAGCCEECR
jgi:hypothetical protein